jgi:hypothetical protein
MSRSPGHSKSPLGTSSLPRLQWERCLPGAVALTLCIGIVALVCDFCDLPQPRIFNMHLLFGAAVSGVLTACLVRKRLALAPGASVELYSYTRRVTRLTYILLYVLALVRLGLHLLELRLAHGSSGLASGAAGGRIHSMDDFQIYIVYCIAPLWLLRALVLRWPAGRAPEGRPPEQAVVPGVVPSS